jgi:hypothetical protein
MGLNKDLLVFDTADTSESDNVGAYVRSSDGTLITHETIGSDEHLHVAAALQDGSGNAITSTTVGSDQALDVNVSGGSITADMDGIYNVSTNADPDNIGLIGHTRAASIGDAQQVERLSSGAPSSDDIDPANVKALDVNGFLLGWDGSAWDRLTASSGALDVNLADQDADITVDINAQSVGALDVEGSVADDAADSGNPVKIGSRSVDQSSALSAISAASDRADALSDLYRRILVSNSAAVGLACADFDVISTEVALPTTNLAGRVSMIVQNLSQTQPIYVGPTGVTTSTGLKIPKGGSLEIPAGEAIDLYGIAPSGTQDVRVFELA